MRVYQLLMYLFPASFRAEYGSEMFAIFARRCEAAPNRVALVATYAAAFCDAVIDAASAHLDILRQDLRYTARSLLQTPAFTLTTICIVAIGVGANTAVFSMIDHVLIRPLPFRDSEQIGRASCRERV